MLTQLPDVQVPAPIARICKLNLNNTRVCFSEIVDIIEKDQFLRLFVQDCFADFLKKGGMLGMLTALGWDGFRNRLAQAYFEHTKLKRYMTNFELDDVQDVLDLEKRFDFLFAETNSRVFLLGYFLKACDLHLEVSKQDPQDFIMVPKEIDEFLVRSNVRTETPDFLILTLWALMQILGENVVIKTLQDNKGDINQLKELLDEKQLDDFLTICTQYGFSIDEVDFFVATKV